MKLSDNAVLKSGLFNIKALGPVGTIVQRIQYTVYNAV
jgi:hypothetical protein